jgi:hypothetical protein
MPKVTLKEVEATVLKLEDGDALIIRVDPDEFTEDLQQPFMDALEAAMEAAGHDTARCMVVAAHKLELTIVRA